MSKQKRVKAGMKAFLAVTLGGAISAGCAATGDSSPRATGRTYPSYAFRGDNEHLDQLVSAGRACGYAEDELEVALETPHLTPVVILVIPATPNARFECVTQWIRNHPETGFRL